MIGNFATIKVKCKKCGYIVYHKGKLEVDPKCRKCGSTECVVENIDRVVTK